MILDCCIAQRGLSLMISNTHKLVAPLLGVWRHRWLALGLMWAVGCLGWAYVWAIKDIYRSTARVYVDSETVLRPLLTGLAVGTDVDTDIEMMRTLLLSRPNLQAVAKTTGLAAKARTPQELERVVQDLSRQIYLSGDREGTYTLAYRHTDPAMAQRVVSLLLDDFVRETVGHKRDDSTEAQRFLMDQLKSYELKLRGAESALADFKQKHIGLMPGQTGDYYTSMQQLMTNVEGLQTRYRQLNERRVELERQLDGEEPTFGTLSSSPDSGPYDGQIADLQARIEQLRLQYTDRHPDILMAQQTIEQLRAENRRLRAEGNAGLVFGQGGGAVTSSQRLAINPVYQTIRVSLSQTNAELAEVRGQLGEYQGQLARLRSRVSVAPEIEAQLAQLNRDYEVNRAQYTALLQRLESARISESAQENTDKLKFRIVDPPLLPLLPDEPNRPLLVTLFSVFAIGAGLAAAFLLSLLRPVFASRTDIQEVLGLRVLGSVSRSLDRVVTPWYTRDGTLAMTALALFVGGCLANIALWRWIV
jgi:polysaccharide chain length determinant protein (PEP-CTERM system associated)